MTAARRLAVTIAGSGNAFGSGGRMQACIHLDSGEGPTALLDCGATSLVALKRLGIDPGAVSTVFVSHLHGDHFGGLPFLILDGQFSRRTTPLTIIGPTGTAERLRQAMEVFFPGSSTVERRFTVDTIELEPGENADVDGIRATVWAASHPSGAPALLTRLGIGSAEIAYTGDTAWTADIVAVAAGADLLVAETYRYERDVPHHLSYRTIEDRQRDLTAKRVVVTHMSDDVLGRLDLLGPRFEPAYDGMRILI